jgi:hypothetical protein
MSMTLTEWMLDWWFTMKGTTLLSDDQRQRWLQVTEAGKVLRAW